MQAALPSGRIGDGLRIQHRALESLHRTNVGLRCTLFDRNAEACSREVYCRSINDFALLDEIFD
jgi:hypothetical protein